ncbi:MAG: flagellar basal body-associated protein FliL [Nitrospirota bacterium]
MADENKEKKTDSSPQKKPFKLIIILVMVLLILGGGGFFLFTKFFVKNGEVAKNIVSDIEVDNELDVKDEIGIMVPLETFIVNLADKDDVRYLKVTMQVEVKDNKTKEKIAERSAQIRDAIIVLLSSKDYDSIRSVEGKFRLRDEIIERITNILNTNKVITVYFTEFVVQ